MGSRLAPGRARFGGLTAWESQVSGVGNWPPGPPGPSRDFLGNSRISGTAKIRQISENLAISDSAPRNGRVSWGFRASGAQMRGVATGAWKGPTRGANSMRVSGFWGWVLAPRIPEAPPLPRRFLGEFRNFQNSPNFREFRDVGPFAPKRTAVSGIPGFARSDSGGRGRR